MKDLRGLTIIEVLIAISIIGVVFAALAALQISNLRVTRAAGEDTERLELAVAEFEDQKRLIEQDYTTYLDCPANLNLCEPSDLNDTVQIAIRGRPTLSAVTSDLAASGPVETNGLVGVDIRVTTDAGVLQFRQFVSCLEATSEAPPSVAVPGPNCE